MRKRWLLVLGCIFLVILGINTWAARGTGVRVKKTTTKAVVNPIDWYNESHALLIGASAYNNGWPKLSGVLNDIPAVQAALEKQGFTVTTVMDPDHVALPKAFDDFIHAHGRDVNNRLLFYFAGHGHTDKKSWDEDMGYIVPIDAPSPEVDLDGFLRFGLDMQQIEVYAKRINSKHALFVFDSCFSGSIFALSRAIPASINYKTASPVRQFITSGSAEESVPDRSDFRVQFESALAGEADSNKDGYITGTELGVFLQDTVINYSRDSQHPQYGTIRNPKLDKGDFVFQIAEAEPSPSAVVSSTPPPPLPPKSQFSLSSLKAKEQERSAKAGWDKWQAEMQSAFDEASDFAGSAAARREAWELFLTAYAENNTYSAEDERLRKEAKRKQAAVRDDPVVVDKLPPVLVPELLPYEPETVAIPAGSFEIGSPDSEVGRSSDEGPVHTVNIEAFRMGKYEVTRGQFRAFVDATSYKTEAEQGDGCYGWTGSTWEKKSEFNWLNMGFAQEDNHPVACVSWNDAMAYTEWLSEQTGKSYRLPSEAEWEYAARAGTTTARYWGNNPNQACKYANVADQIAKSSWSASPIHECDDGYGFTSPVGQFKANAFKLYDMLGNVWELTCSQYDSNGYSGKETTCANKVNSDARAVRGGSWIDKPVWVRAANRYGNAPSNRDGAFGFRLVQD